jgi:hypothetical protein
MERQRKTTLVLKEKGMEDPYKDEVVAKAAAESLRALDMIMDMVKQKKLDVCSYRDFIDMLNSPEYSHIKDVLDKTKAALQSNDVKRNELRIEVNKQREGLE